VASASEPGMIVTNGMSEFARDKENANSALVVSVEPGDFGSSHPWPVLIFRESGKGWLLLRAVPATGTGAEAWGFYRRKKIHFFGNSQAQLYRRNESCRYSFLSSDICDGFHKKSHTLF